MKTAHTVIVATCFILSLQQIASTIHEATDDRNKQTGAKIDVSFGFWLLLLPFVANWLASLTEVLNMGFTIVDIKQILVNTVAFIVGFITFVILLSAGGSSI